MKYQIEINESLSALENYLFSIIGDDYSMLENRKIIGKIKNNNIKLEYNNRWKRYPTGIVFYGKVINNGSSSIICGYFIFAPSGIIVYSVICFIAGMITFKNSFFDCFIIVIFIFIFFLIDLYFSYEQKKYIINFLHDVKQKKGRI